MNRNRSIVWSYWTEIQLNTKGTQSLPTHHRIKLKASGIYAFDLCLQYIEQKNWPTKCTDKTGNERKMHECRVKIASHRTSAPRFPYKGHFVSVPHLLMAISTIIEGDYFIISFGFAFYFSLDFSQSPSDHLCVKHVCRFSPFVSFNVCYREQIYRRVSTMRSFSQ